MSRIRNKYVFLSGPMSDDAETYHVHDFVSAHVKLKEAGAYRVYDPAIEWLTYYGAERTHQEWMLDCIHRLTDSCLGCALVSLPGWENSQGARAERMVAEWCGIECMTLEEALS
jgi:hypothetical protein